MEYRFSASKHTAEQLRRLQPRDRDLWLASFNYDIYLSPWAHKLVSWVMREQRSDLPLIPSFDDRALKRVIDLMFNLGLTAADTEVRQLHADLFEFLNLEWRRRQESMAVPRSINSEASSGKLSTLTPS